MAANKRISMFLKIEVPQKTRFTITVKKIGPIHTRLFSDSFNDYLLVTNSHHESCWGKIEWKIKTQ